VATLEREPLSALSLENEFQKCVCVLYVIVLVTKFLTNLSKVYSSIFSLSSVFSTTKFKIF
jgi:hypothetical protein